MLSKRRQQRRVGTLGDIGGTAADESLQRGDDGLALLTVGAAGEAAEALGEGGDGVGGEGWGADERADRHGGCAAGRVGVEQ